MDGGGALRGTNCCYVFRLTAIRYDIRCRFLRSWYKWLCPCQKPGANSHVTVANHWKYDDENNQIISLFCTHNATKLCVTASGTLVNAVQFSSAQHSPQFAVQCEPLPLGAAPCYLLVMLTRSRIAIAAAAGAGADGAAGIALGKCSDPGAHGWSQASTVLHGSTRA